MNAIFKYVLFCSVFLALILVVKAGGQESTQNAGSIVTRSIGAGSRLPVTTTTDGLCAQVERESRRQAAASGRHATPERTESK